MSSAVHTLIRSVVLSFWFTSSRISPTNVPFTTAMEEEKECPSGIFQTLIEDTDIITESVTTRFGITTTEQGYIF